jgi:hypothetical protein
MVSSGPAMNPSRDIAMTSRTLAIPICTPRRAHPTAIGARFDPLSFDGRGALSLLSRPACSLRAPPPAAALARTAGRLMYESEEPREPLSILAVGGLPYAFPRRWLNLSDAAGLQESHWEDKMDFSTQFQTLETRTAEALAAVRSAATESRDQLRARIDQAQVDLDLASKDSKQKAGEATDRAKSKWAQMKADATAKRDDVKAKIDKRNAQLDAKMAANDAEWAEADAADAIDYAQWMVENARLAALDAIDARIYADERALAAKDAP